MAEAITIDSCVTHTRPEQGTGVVIHGVEIRKRLIETSPGFLRNVFGVLRRAGKV
jgi:hypothetical protein